LCKIEQNPISFPKRNQRKAGEGKVESRWKTGRKQEESRRHKGSRSTRAGGARCKQSN